MRFQQSLPYISENIDGMGGEIKTKPEYFKVEEIPAYQTTGNGNHLYVNITKRLMTTRKVQKSLAELFNKHPHDVGLAGLKDKYALTSQTFSINLGLYKNEEKSKLVDKIEENLPVTVNWADLHPKKLRRGHLKGNKFDIVITNLDTSIDDAYNRTQKIISILGEKGIPNYYGIQRFGEDLENVRRGYEILFEGRRINESWLHTFLISSFLSFLCNIYLTERVKNGYFLNLLKGDIAQRYDSGGRFLVEDLKKEQDRYNGGEISFTAPIYGFKMRKAKSCSASLEREIYERYNLSYKIFKQNKIKGTRRLGRLIPRILSEKKSNGINLKFSLPRGAYATIIIREFTKT
jgi:tRNA pseudouridine13 synthase